MSPGLNEESTCHGRTPSESGGAERRFRRRLRRDHRGFDCSGSVTVLRLTEQDYRTAWLEAGRRFTPDSPPKVRAIARAGAPGPNSHVIASAKALFAPRKWVQAG